MRYVTQDPKYDIEVASGGAYLVNSATGEPIPMDCPVFMFLATDRKALPHLCAYMADCENSEHAAAVERRIVDFEQYAIKRADSMRIL